MSFTPDPDLLRAIDEILATAPPSYVEWRQEQLDNRELCKESPEDVANFHDPVVLKRQIQRHIERLDPYSEANLRRDRFVEALEAGGHVVMTHIATGEVGMEWDVPKTREGSAPRN